MEAFAVYFGLVGLVALAVLRRPAVALGGMLCMFGLEQWAQSKSGFFYSHQLLTNVLMGSILLYAVAAKPFKGQAVLKPVPRVAALVAALFVYAAASSAWTIAPPGVSLSNWRAHLPYLITLSVLMPLVVGSLRDLRAGFLMTLFVGGVLLTLLMFTSNWYGRQIILDQGEQYGSVIGNKGNPLAIASLAGWVTLLAALMNFPTSPAPLRLARWAVVGLGLAVLLRSESRGQLLGVIAAGVVFLPVSRRIRDLKGFAGTSVALVMLLGIAYAAFDAYAAGTTRWSVDEMVGTYQGSRIGTAMQVLDVWSDGGPFAWVFGLGSSASFSPSVLGFYPHLVPLEVLAELGVFGFGLLSAIAFVTLRSTFRMSRRLAEWPEERGLVAAMGALFLFEVVLAFKQGSLLGNWYSMGFAVLIGRLEIITRRYEGTAPGDLATALDAGDDVPLADYGGHAEPDAWDEGYAVPAGYGSDDEDARDADAAAFAGYASRN